MATFTCSLTPHLTQTDPFSSSFSIPNVIVSGLVRAVGCSDFLEAVMMNMEDLPEWLLNQCKSLMIVIVFLADVTEDTLGQFA